MSYEKQIHDYLNGDLSAEEQNELFKAMAQHPEYRSELSLQMKMQQAIQGDLANTIVPQTATASLFERLGFQAPAPVAPSMWAQLASRASLSIRSMNGVGWIGSAVVVASVGYFAATSGSRLESAPNAAVRTAASPLSVQQSNALTHVRSELLPHNVTNEEKKGHAVSLQATSVVQPQSSSSDRTDERTIGSNASLPLISASSQPEATTDNSSPASISKGNVVNDPNNVLVDVDKFSSSAYLSNSRIIGVADAGAIYCSDDAGATWTIQPSQTRSDLTGVNFYDRLHGIIVGAGGTILTTNNSGKNWTAAQSGVGASLSTVVFATKDTAYACGANGTVLRSINRGANWLALNTGVNANLFILNFENGMTGIARGENGIVLHTTDAGKSWR